MFRKDAKDIFDVEIPDSGIMDSYIQRWYNITAGNPEWTDEEDEIVTINFAQFIDEVTSGLVALDIGVSLPDSPRGKLLQNAVDYVLQKIGDTVSDALGNAGIMFKPNGETIDYFMPDRFAPTSWDSNGNIDGCIFVEQADIGDKHYFKYEYHRYEDYDGERAYAISNRAFVSTSTANKGKPCELSAVPKWAKLQPDTYLLNIERPLFAYYGNPKPNTVDRYSPLSMPIWANCLNELRDLDIAWSRKSTEIEDSKHITFLPETALQYAEHRNIKLPRFLKGIQTGNIENNAIHEHTATLLTADRIADINATLAMISSKLGFDQGFFVLNEKTGAITATQVEADDQSTIRTIKNLRDPLKNALIQTLYAVNKFADLFSDVPPEPWTTNYQSMAGELSDAFNFGDITYSYEEDKAAWWKYRIQGDVPAWMYYTKFEGMSEDDAKAMIAETQKAPTLFGEEE